MCRSNCRTFKYCKRKEYL